MKILVPHFPYNGWPWLTQLLHHAFGLPVFPIVLESHIPGFNLPVKEVENIDKLEPGIYETCSFTCQDAIKTDAFLLHITKPFKLNLLQLILFDRHNNNPSRWPEFKDKFSFASDRAYVNLFVESHPKEIETLYRSWMMFDHKIYSARSFNTTYGHAKTNPLALLSTIAGHSSFELHMAPTEAAERAREDMAMLKQKDKEFDASAAINQTGLAYIDHLNKRLSRIKTYSKH